MAQYMNVSGQDRDLYLPEWLGPRHVEAGATVDVEDDLANLYSFDQPGVWETVTEPKKKKTTAAPAAGDTSNVGSA